MSNWPFDPLPPLTFDCVMADPPWSFDNFSVKGELKNAKTHYDCMSLDKIKALPVSQLIRGDGYLWLWATNPMLDQAFEVMRAWGFRFVTAGTWVKLTAHDAMAFGPGYVLRSANEPFLIGRIGNPPIGSRSLRSVVLGRVREHSRKPDEAYEHFRLMTPTAMRRADLFARESRPGFEAWGHEATRFDGAAS